MAVHSESPSIPAESLLGQKSANGTYAHMETSHEEVNTSAYKIKEQWHSKPSKLRVIHVGAGAAGLLMAYKMKKLFENYDLVCYEK